MKAIRENVRVLVQVRDPPFQPDREKFFTQHKQDAEEVVKQIKRHCDDVFGVEVVWDTRNVCEHCGYGWDDPKDKFNDCCDASAHPNEEEQK